MVLSQVRPSLTEWLLMPSVQCDALGLVNAWIQERAIEARIAELQAIYGGKK